MVVALSVGEQENYRFRRFAKSGGGDFTNITKIKMPEIKVAHVVSFSSEDKNHPAQNLLKAEGTSKWRSGNVGESSVTCVLQLEKAVKISQLDIGNEGSAFIEVLVGRSSGSDSDFQVILVASSFMNPGESRSGQNMNRVRIFTADKLNHAVQDQKWDRVKVVCSQPFNKGAKYGLSFIKLHSPGDSSDPAAPAQTSLGAFKLKAEEPTTSLKAGSLFANRNKEESTPSKPLTGAAAVRAASKQVEEDMKNGAAKQTTQRSKEPEATPSPRPAPIKPRQAEPKASREERRDKGEAGGRGDRVPMKRQSNSTSSVTSEQSRHGSPPPIKKSRSEPPKEAASRPFGRIMKSVVFVLSGFQNPQRGEIRDQALEMGAKYRPDWGRDCTHLVCAFANTPKYNEVRKRGRIVTSQWVDECYKRKKLLPWRKFRLGNAPSPPGSSGSEDEEEEAPIRKPNRETPKAKPSTSHDLDSDDPVLYEGSTDEDGDTDDEIQRIQAKNKDSKPKHTSTTDKSRESPPVIELEDSSDGEEDMLANLPELPNFFSGKHFLLYGDHSATERRTLLRFIIAYNGKVEEYMSSTVQYVLSKASWDDNFDDALSENPNLSFVRPQWVHACHDKQKLLPHQKYVIIPQD